MTFNFSSNFQRLAKMQSHCPKPLLCSHWAPRQNLWGLIAIDRTGIIPFICRLPGKLRPGLSYIFILLWERREARQSKSSALYRESVTLSVLMMSYTLAPFKKLLLLPSDSLFNSILPLRLGIRIPWETTSRLFIFILSHQRFCRVWQRWDTENLLPPRKH